MLKAIFISLCLALALSAPARADTPDLVLTGELDGAAHHTYHEAFFDVPEGVTRITVEFSYTGKEQRSVIDLGLRDPKGFRGWSGGNKSRFTVSTSDATPSYLPGDLPAGRWTLLLGVPNMRKDGRAAWEAKIHFGRKGDPLPETAFEGAPVRNEARWYRGDLHAHTAHSDGSCLSRSGEKRVPCPLFLTLEAAAARGLDFIAVTEHNTTSHHNEMRALQPYFDEMLLIPGREITTFYGHANIFGPTEFVDFELGSARLPSVAALGQQVRAAGSLLSINHPGMPTGELCMGCGWDAKDTDFSYVEAIEVVNGGSLMSMGGNPEGPFNGVPFWEARLNEGHRITAIAGSDNHDATAPAARQAPVGVPATVIHAESLTQTALLEGIRKGRVFIDLSPETGERLLDLKATHEKNSAVMGENLAVRRGGRVSVGVEVKGVPSGQLEAIVDGQPHGNPIPFSGDEVSVSFTLTAKNGPRQWVRVNIRDADGKLLMISNPVYLDIK